MLILNSSRPGTSLYKYAEMAYRALAGQARFVNLVVNPELDFSAAAGDILVGFHSGLYSLDVGINELVPRAGFGRAATAIFNATAHSEIIYYASLDVPVFRRTPQSVVTVHDSPLEALRGRLYSVRRRYQFLQRQRLKAHSRSSHMLATSRHVMTGLRAFGVEADITVIYPPVNPIFKPCEEGEDSRTVFGLPSDKKLILSVSSAEPRKNLNTTSEVIRRLGDNYRLVRVGPPVMGATNFYDLPAESLARLYRVCDVLLAPSLAEGFGSPIVEAMASGLPVVASDIPVMREILGDSGELAPPTDAPCLARAIEAVVGSPIQYRNRGLRRSQLYSFKKFSDEIRSYFKGLAS